MRAFILIYFLIGCVSAPPTFAQPPILTLNFDTDTTIFTREGVQGRALDLGDRNPARLAVTTRIPVAENDSCFSISLWVKSALESTEYYVIASSLEVAEKTIRKGWKIAVLPSGAWEFEAIHQDIRYRYAATAPSQTIRDGKWHLLTVTYSLPSEILTFYYDGVRKALYYAQALGDFYRTRELVVGNTTLDRRKTVTVESGWETFYGCIDEVQLYNHVLSEAFIRSYYENTTGSVKLESPVAAPVRSLKVTAFNIWKGGNQFGKEVGKARLIRELRKIDADIFLIVETEDSGPALADALDYQLFVISSNLSILSRFPIIETYAVYEPYHSGGAMLVLPNGYQIRVFCNWLSSQPQYFIAGLTHQESWPLDKYLEEENKTRGRDIRAILRDMAPHLQQTDSIPVIMGGDFNSGSHLDWTEATKALHNNYVVPWPVSSRLLEQGFKDAYREIHPDPLTSPGLTWSPIRAFPLKDRIDYIYYKGKKIQAISSEIHDQAPDGWPSDHAAVSVTFELP